MATTSKLPDRPSLENLKKRAKHLHKELKGGDPDSVARVKEHLPRLSAVPEAEVPDIGVTLQEVQYVIAVEYGYVKWCKLVDDIGEEDSAANMMRRLWGRPRLESLKKQARDVQKRVKAGDSRYVPWAKGNLPRLADIPDAEVPDAGVTLEEAQQVIAAGYGYSRWDELVTDVDRFRPVSCFEDLADLEDGEIEEIIARVGRDDLAVAMKAASDRFKDRFLGMMSEKERRALTDRTEFLGPMLLSDVEVVQRGIVEKFRSEPLSDDVFV